MSKGDWKEAQRASVSVQATVDQDGALSVLAGGKTAIKGNLVSGEWFAAPTVFRLLLNGTGQVTIDSIDADGNITAGVFAQTLAAAVNVIAFPYPGDTSIAIRPTFTGTATAKVL